jgi:hypothetical protein
MECQATRLFHEYLASVGGRDASQHAAMLAYWHRAVQRASIDQGTAFPTDEQVRQAWETVR